MGAMLAMTGCSGNAANTDEDEIGNAGLDTLPACNNVWRTGQTLARNYNGCSKGDTVVPPVFIDCTDRSSLVTYDERFYAVTGKEITRITGKMTADPGYRAAHESRVGGATAKTPAAG
jgi:hypothetical protein